MTRLKSMHLLIVTPKVCYRVGSTFYSIGGSPAEFNALAEHCQVALIASIVRRSRVEPGWQAIDPAVRCFSVGTVGQLGSVVPPFAAMTRCMRVTTGVLRCLPIDVALLKGPSEVSMAPLHMLASRGIPCVHHYSLDWLADVEVSRKKSAVRRALRPYFWLAHGYRQAVLRTVLPRGDALATVSSHYVRKLTPYHEDPVLLMPETFTIAEGEVDTAPRSRASRRNRFLFVGRIDRNKNLALIVRALDLLVRHGNANSPTVDIVGDGEDRATVVAHAKRMGLVNRINFAGYVHNRELREYYSRSLALILPSRSETLGQVILESFAAGTPVIASNVGGIPDLVTDGVNGYLIDPGSPASLAEKMRHVLDSQHLYEGLQTAALRTARQMARERTAQAWVEVLHGVARRRRRAIRIREL